MAPPVLVTITSAIGFGTPRFRQAAEIPIVLLAGVALSALLQTRADRRRPLVGRRAGMEQVTAPGGG